MAMSQPSIRVAASRTEGIETRKTHQIEQVLTNNGVVHRAALEVSAVGQNLFRKLLPQNCQPLVSPCIRFRPGKIHTGKH